MAMTEIWNKSSNVLAKTTKKTTDELWEYVLSINVKIDSFATEYNSRWLVNKNSLWLHPGIQTGR